MALQWTARSMRPLRPGVITNRHIRSIILCPKKNIK